jgi:drug/metabolite transporter (DMT)-like permease
LWLAAVLVAASTALYAEGLLRGQVARVMLLFYLTPVWSTLFGRLMLDERITPARIATIALGLAGMLTIVARESGAPVPHNAGEWMGLASGVFWGLGMVYLRRTQGVSATDKTAAIFLFLGPFFLLLNLLPGGRDWILPSGDGLAAAVPWLIALALAWTLPVIWLTAFGGSGIDPGRVAILLMLEVVIGLVSAAWLTNEPFGVRELVGGMLIVSAGAAEFVVGAARPARS